MPPGWDATAVASVGPVREDMAEKQDKRYEDERETLMNHLSYQEPVESIAMKMYG